MKTIVINSGYFNPIHPGHIECMELSKNLADENGELWVIVNNDIQAHLKRGVKSFQDQDYRMRIVGALKAVDRVFLSIDQDPSVCATLLNLSKLAKQEFGDSVRIIFAKGGDRSLGNSPETPICIENEIEIMDGLGLKTHNSSEYIKHTLNALDK
jgi:cytidyltransferase-like protein